MDKILNKYQKPKGENKEQKQKCFKKQEIDTQYLCTMIYIYVSYFVLKLI